MKQIAERFSLKLVRNMTVGSIKTLNNKNLSRMTIGEIKLKTNTRRANQFTVKEMVFLKKLKGNVQLTSSDDKESGSSNSNENE